MSSEAERRERLKELCGEAFRLSPEQRQPFLLQACAGDVQLQHDIEALLAADEAGYEMLDQTAWKIFAPEFARDDTEILIDQQIGRYQIKSLLGQGGMGKVFLAEDLTLHRAVAIKVLLSHFTLDLSDLRRFEQEARTISALHHPNILTIYEIGQQDKLRFMVTELVEGQTLREKIRTANGAGLDWRVVVRLALQIAEALQAAHTAQIIHRDIKPENIMVGANGHVKVLDFGIAKRGVMAEGKAGNSAVEWSHQTSAGTVTGTANYMSPEQWCGKPLDERTDIFSFGVVLYEMLTGRRPYEGLSKEATSTALCSKEEIRPVREVCPTIPAALDSLVTRTLQKSPPARCAAQEMALELRELNSFLDVSQQGEESLQAKNANRLLNQSVALFAADSKRRIPLDTLWTIWRHANLQYGALEREVLRKSLFRGLAKSGQWALAVLAIAMGIGVLVAREMSVGPVWEEHLLRDGHTKRAPQIAFSPDGHWLISVSDDKTVMVWDFAQRKRWKTLTHHTERVNAIAFSPDGKWFATGSHDKAVIVWDADTFEKITTLREHRDAVNAVAFSPDGKWLASASSGNIAAGSDFRTVLWETGRWEKVREIPQGVVYGPILFSLDSRLLVTNQVQWDLVSGNQSVNDDLPLDKKWGGWNWAAFSPEAKLLVGTGGDGDVLFRSLSRLTDLTSSRLIQKTHAHQDFGRAVAFSLDGKLMATGTDVILLWDVATRKIVSRFDDVSSVWSLAFSPNGRWLVSAHGDGSIQVRDLNDRHRTVGFDGHGDQVLVVASSPDGKKIASAGKDGAVILWHAETEQKETVLFGHQTRVVNLAFSPDGTWLTSFDQDGYLIRWELANKAPCWKVKACSGTECLAISPDGRWIANPCGVYESSRGQLVTRWEQAQARISVADSAAFSPDGKAVTIVGEKKVILFDTQTWRTIAHQEALSKLTRIRYSPNGRSLLTGSENGRLTWWNAATLRQEAEVQAHKAAVSAVSFSSEGNTIASADKDEIVIWAANHRKRITTIGPQASAVSSLAFSPDGKRLLVARRDRIVRVYKYHLMRWGTRLD